MFVKVRKSNAVEVENLVKTHGDGPTAVRALDGVSLGFASGEFTAIMGPSGSGKSSLLHTLGTLDKPSTGRIETSAVSVEAEGEVAALEERLSGALGEGLRVEQPSTRTSSQASA